MCQKQIEIQTFFKKYSKERKKPRIGLYLPADLCMYSEQKVLVNICFFLSFFLYFHQIHHSVKKVGRQVIM